MAVLASAVRVVLRVGEWGALGGVLLSGIDGRQATVNIGSWFSG